MLVGIEMEEENEVVKTFAELGVREELVKACERLGWKNPSKIQAEALPYALEGKVFHAVYIFMMILIDVFVRLNRI